MFTGLIERVGVVKSRSAAGSSARLKILWGSEPYEIKAGDSVAVDGLCLTASLVEEDGFFVDVSRESLERSTLKNLRPGARVNLERALRLGDRLGGHLVTGHIDAVGRIVECRPEGHFARITISAPSSVLDLTVEKGSIAVDGISLTVNGISRGTFWVMVIPETLARTTLGLKKAGDEVNLETDLLGKYVAKLLGKQNAGPQEDALLSRLKEQGFL